MTASSALLVQNLHVQYGSSHVLQGVDLDVVPGQAVALLGRNGAGKSTALRAIMNLIPSRSARLELFGAPVAGMASVAVVRRGMTLVLEDRGVFPSLSVAECLGIAAAGTCGPWTRARVLELFPRLSERLGHRCGQLSGGEQQMLAIGRALLLDPKVLLLDEPTQGLAPIIVREVLDTLAVLKTSGISLLLVEQNLAFAGRLADHVCVLGRGIVQWSGPVAALEQDRDVLTTWLGA